MQRALRLTLAVYGGLLLGPMAALASLPTWPGFAVGAAVGGVVALALTTDLEGPEPLLGLSRIVAGFALPLGWLAVAVDRATSISTFLFAPWFAGALAALVWAVAVVIAAEWRTRRRIAELAERIVFEARNPPTTRRNTKIAAVAALVLMAGASVLFYLGAGEGTSMYWLFAAQLPVWIPILAGGSERTVAIAAGGVRIERRVHDWDEFNGYELTDESLSLSRPAWYHAELAFDRSDVEDLDAVIDEIEKHLDRR